jgi:hypothetical protein
MITPDKLLAALNAAKPGDTLVLVGDFPALRWGKRSFDPPLVLDMTKATVSGPWYWGSLDGVTFKGGKWRGLNPLRIDKASRITIDGGDFQNPGLPDGNGFWVIGGSQITVRNTTFSQFERGCVFSKVDGIVVENSGFDRMRSDGISMGECRNVRVTGCAFHGTRIVGTEHPDAVQLWSRPTSPPTSDVVVEDNVIVGMTQGVFLGNHVRAGVDDGGFDRVTIRRNRIVGGYPQGIHVTAGRGVTVEDNTVSTYPAARYRASINLVGCSDVIRTGNTVAAGAGKPAVIDPT